MLEFGTLVYLIMVIAQTWKKLGLNADLIPILNVILGLILSLILFGELEFLYRIKQGLMIGLSASGTHDIGRCFKKCKKIPFDFNK